MTVAGVPALGAASRDPGRAAAAAEASRGGSYLGHWADVRAEVWALAATPRSGRKVRVGAKPWIRSRDSRMRSGMGALDGRQSLPQFPRLRNGCVCG